MKRQDFRPPETPPRTVIYAVGDVHGRLDLVKGVTGELAKAAQTAKRAKTRLIAVFLGDYIDRGPNSRDVVDHLIAFRDQNICETLFLRGNHEQVLLDILDGADQSLRWLEYGGIETLKSYGIRQPLPEAVRGAGKLKTVATAAVPARHVDFLRSTELTGKFGDYLFVHAGLRPDRLLEEQSSADLLWFRYYDDETPAHSETVVHGHSANARPVLGRHRIGIDTEAYASGALTVLRLEGGRKEFLKVEIAGADPATVVGFWRTIDGAYDPAHRAPASAAPEPRVQAAPPRPARAAAATRRKSRRLQASVLAALFVVGGTTAGFALQRGRTPPPQAASRVEATGPVPGAPEQAVAAVAYLEPPADPAAGALRGPVEAGPPQTANAPPAPDAAAETAVPAAAPAPAAPQPAEPAGPRVQIGAVRSQAAAEQAWRELAAALPATMSSKGMQIEAASTGSESLYRSYVVGFATPDEASRFCRELSASRRPCIVRR